MDEYDTGEKTQEKTSNGIATIGKKVIGEKVKVSNLDLQTTLAPRLKSLGIFSTTKKKRDYEYKKVKPNLVFSRDDPSVALSKATNDTFVIKTDPERGKMYINELWSSKLNQQIQSASKLMELHSYMSTYKKNIDTIR